MDTSNETKSRSPILARSPGYVRTQRGSQIIDGLEWRSYRVNVNRYAWIADHDIAGWVQRNAHGGGLTYHAEVNGEGVGRSIRSEHAALTLATKAIRRMEEIARQK